MLRKTFVIVFSCLTMLVGVAATASAETEPYPAPSVTSGQTTTQTVVSTSYPPATTSSVVVPVDGGSLASTGAGLNVGMTLGIGAAVVLAGVAMTVLGARRMRRDH